MSTQPCDEKSEKKIQASGQFPFEREQTEQGYRRLIENLNDVLYTVGLDGIVRYVSSPVETVLGYTPAEIVGSRFSNLIHPDDREAIQRAFEKILQGRLQPNEYRIRTKSGGYRWVRTSSRAVYENGQACGLQGVLSDVTERIEREIEHTQMLKTVPDGFWVVDMDGNILEVNPAAARMLGYTPEEMLSLTISDIDPDQSAGDIRRQLRSLWEAGSGMFETRHRHRDGHLIDVEVSLNFLSIGQGRFVVLNRDISERKRIESERKTTLQLLALLSSAGDLHALMARVTFLLREASGCEAVGIRLREGEDYPYYETRGFPREFVLAESRLCAVDSRGEAVRDVQGNPLLECMCGNVIRGRFDPRLPFFTEYGSFWTNSTSDFSAGAGEKNRPPLTRNRCHDRGYESLALIPLRHGSDTLGLLQFNSIRRNRFDRRQIVLFERLAGSLAIGLTQRYTAEALRTSEEQYRQLFEYAPIGIFRTNSKGKALSANPAMAHILGINSPQEAVAFYSNLGEQLYVDAEKRNQFLQQLKEKGFVENFEYKAHTADGRQIWLNMNARRGHGGRDGAWVIEGFTNDITERKQSEEALRESEKRFRDLAEMLPEAVFETDMEMNLTFANRQAFTMFGYSRQDFEKGLNGVDMFAPEDRQRVRETAAKRIQGEKFGANEFCGLRKNGTVFPVLFHTSPIVNQETVVGLRGIVVDISERKKIEKRLQQAQKMESIGNLAGGIAHDFNNILFPIVGLSELLLEDLSPDSPGYQNVNMILTAGKRASDLVKQILAFSRQSEPQKRPVRLQQVLKEVLKLSRSTIPSDIEISQDIQDDCGVIMADPSQLHQVSMNLITNAYHAVESNSGNISVTLRQRCSGTGDPAGDSFQSGPCVILSVSDTGTGIAPDIIDNIFEPYFTTKEQGKGTGLGLAVVYGIVKEYGGDIRVRSDPGNGTTVQVLLPLMEKTGGMEKSAGPAPHYDTGTERILLVDDEEPIAMLEKQMLERLGYRVTERFSSADALRAFRANPDTFDLVITDMAMPGMTGDNLARELISIKPGIPVIICTGFSEKINEEKAKAIGIRRFLMKPVLRSEMARMVREILDETHDPLRK